MSATFLKQKPTNRLATVKAQLQKKRSMVFQLLEIVQKAADRIVLSLTQVLQWY